MLYRSDLKFPNFNFHIFHQKLTLVKIMILILCLAILPTCLGSLRPVYTKQSSSELPESLSNNWNPKIVQEHNPVTSTDFSTLAQPYPPPRDYQKQLWSSGPSQNYKDFNGVDKTYQDSFSAPGGYNDGYQQYQLNSSSQMGAISSQPTQFLNSDLPRVDSYLPQNYQGQYHEGHHKQQYDTAGYGQDHSGWRGSSADFEIQDKVFSKTVAATKLLKLGKLIFTLCMVLVVFVLAGLGKAGVVLSPAALPLALLPIGFIALILFVPLFLAYVPVVATGHAGGGEGRRRRKRNIENEMDPMQLQNKVNELTMNSFILMMEHNMKTLLEKIR